MVKLTATYHNTHNCSCPHHKCFNINTDHDHRCHHRGMMVVFIPLSIILFIDLQYIFSVELLQCYFAINRQSKGRKAINISIFLKLVYTTIIRLDVFNMFSFQHHNLVSIFRPTDQAQTSELNDKSTPSHLKTIFYRCCWCSV